MDGRREVRLEVTVTVPDDGTTDAQVAEALDRALDEVVIDRGASGPWILGTVTPLR